MKQNIDSKLKSQFDAVKEVLVSIQDLNFIHEEIDFKFEKNLFSRKELAKYTFLFRDLRDLQGSSSSAAYDILLKKVKFLFNTRSKLVPLKTLRLFKMLNEKLKLWSS